MKCKVGDKVRFLNEVGGGKVTRVDKNTVYVLSDDGFETPVMRSEVIVVNSAAEPKYSGGRSYIQNDNSALVTSRYNKLNQKLKIWPVSTF